MELGIYNHPRNLCSPQTRSKFKGWCVSNSLSIALTGRNRERSALGGFFFFLVSRRLPASERKSLLLCCGWRKKKGNLPKVLALFFPSFCFFVGILLLHWCTRSLFNGLLLPRCSLTDRSAWTLCFSSSVRCIDLPSRWGLQTLCWCSFYYACSLPPFSLYRSTVRLRSRFKWNQRASNVSMKTWKA